MTAFASLFSVDIVGGLIGGLGLFLLAMKLMTDGLKLAGGDALKDLLARWTSTPMRGLLSGMLITALVQSSSAVTVATIGFVNAGLMSLFQAIGVVFGTNIGTTMTAWLVAALGFKVKVEAFALPMIGVGVGFWFLKPGTRRGAIGQALAGFGLFFVGIDTLRTSFESIAPAVNLQVVSDFGALGVAIMVGVGFLLTLLTQSSSAAIAITLTAASGGVIALPSAAAMVIGSNVGTTSTAFLAALGATPNAKRVATAHVIFNGVTGGVALVILPVILFMISRTSAILGLEETPAVALALFHTVFNILGVALMWPFTRKLSHWLAARFRTAEETESKPQYIDKAVATTPELGLNALLLEAGRIGGFAREATAAALTRAPGRGQAVHAKIEAVNALDLAVAEFATNFGKSGLHETVSNPLSQVLRVSQYYTEATEMTASILPLPTTLDTVKDRALHAEMQSYVDAVTEWLQALTPEAYSGSAETLASGFETLESRYHRIKDWLLLAGIAHHVAAKDLGDLLEYLSTLHRLLQRHLKAVRIEASLIGSQDNAALKSEPREEDREAAPAS